MSASGDLAHEAFFIFFINAWLINFQISGAMITNNNNNNNNNNIILSRQHS